MFILASNFEIAIKCAIRAISSCKVQRATASAPKQKRVYWGKKSERQTDRQKNAYNQIQFWVLQCCSYCTLRLRLCEDKVFNFVTFCRSTQWTSQIVDLSEKCSETLKQLLPLLFEPWLSPVAPVYVVRVCSSIKRFVVVDVIGPLFGGMEHQRNTYILDVADSNLNSSSITEAVREKETDKYGIAIKR